MKNNHIMKKIYTLFVLVLFSAASFAEVKITITPSEIDFGTIELKDGEAEANGTATLTWAGITEYCSVFVDTIGKPAADADYEFWAVTNSGYDSWYCGDMYNLADDPTVHVGVYAIAAGEYSIKYVFYSYATEDDWYYDTNRAGNAELTVKVKVVEPGSTQGIERIQSSEIRSQKFIRNGQVLIRRNGEVYSVLGVKE